VPYLTVTIRYATQRTAELFDLILKNGRGPTDWESDPVHIKMQQKVWQMKVVSDCALITLYSSCITKDEDQKKIFLDW